MNHKIPPPIAVLGHVHTGTTALAYILQKAGVSFGEYCNPLFEDGRIIQMYFTAISYQQNKVVNTWKNNHTDIAKQIILSNEHSADKFKYWGFKHPLTSIVTAQWNALLPNIQYIAIIRSPQSWALTMDGVDVFGVCDVATKDIEGGWYEQAGIEWLHCYAPILELKNKFDIPCVIFGAEDFEGSISRAINQLNMKYNGGYDRSRVHQKHADTYIPTSCEKTWNELKYAAC